eukprot:TRINITY_DN3139_c0_g3_i12.p1 TRINITY_DN3139_c0_g3~~TRINITY_DN3139_c0_g3_i12.p1  ORF type:complete len:195 (+),score=36.86 TRINITY_DN3139_c0_g3_i12:1209-1793(+)
MHRWNGPAEFPMVITVFSAPNYCDVYGNKGAVIKFEKNSLNIQQYTASKHPYHLQNYMDVFTWSIPYVCSKIIEIMLSICKKGVADEIESKTEDVNVNIPKSKYRNHHRICDIEEQDKGDVEDNEDVQSAAVSFGRDVRENSAIIEELKGLCPDKKIPRGLLMEGTGALRDAVEAFSKAKKWDLVNERRPTKKP